ncbi:MAG TPA: carbohydrate kinase family protein [Candidatus Paceibacterota bacterium]|nr:carbohydrate kinase family protein [Candidatus Paceibacterota bacterium]
MEKAVDFFAVGDIVVDAFIRLHDASVHCRLDNEDCEICMRWGDKIPYEFAEVVPAVGNSANAAVAAARLGLSSALRAYVGDDMYATQCYAALQIDNVSLDYIEKVPGKHTNYHYVLWFESQRTILVKHDAFEYTVPQMGAGPKWLYLSSLGENSLPYHLALMEKLKEWPDTKLAFQPGTFQMKMGVEALKPVYGRADIFFCNKEEAEKILNKPAGSDIKDLLKAVQALGPKTVVITDDTRGSYSLAPDGKMLHCPRYPDPRPPYEITGAGDALASTTVVALALGKPLEEALMWGATNASSVLQGIGAQKGLLKLDQLQKNLANPPAAFAIEPLS